MKARNIITLCFCLGLGLNAYAQPQKQGIRESSLPEEWKNEQQDPQHAGKKRKDVGVGVPSGIVQSIENVVEASPNNFKNLATFTKGKSDKALNLSGVDTKNVKLVIMYTPATAKWANSIDQGNLKLDGEKATALLTKYGMKLSKVYEAEADRYGLVVKFEASNANVAEAAKEFSKLEGVSMVMVKTKK